MASIRPFIGISLLLAVSACADIGPDGTRAQLTDPTTLGADPVAVIEWPQRQWWQDLHDPQLDQLVAAALADNPGLRVSQARVRQARAIAGIVEDHTYPRADASIALDRELYSAHGSAPAPLAGNYAWRNQAMLSGSYDFDLWGRNRHVLAAALDDIQLAAAESQMARLALQSAIVRSYIELSLQFELQDLVSASLAQRERMLDIMCRRKLAGLASEVEQAQIEATLPAGRREREQVAESIALLRNALAALIGKGPAAGAALSRPRLRLERAPALPGTLPAELLGRRPDIAAQRWRVAAAAQRVDAAKADFYPNINLLAFAGFQAFGFADFLTPDSAVRGIAPAVSLPIFAGPRLRAQLGKQSALYDGAVEQYNATVIAALAEVAGVITRLQSLGRQATLSEAALATALRAHVLAERAVGAGIGDAVTVLNTQVALLYEKQQMAQIDARRLDGYTTLMVALGGGI